MTRYYSPYPAILTLLLSLLPLGLSARETDTLPPLVEERPAQYLHPSNIVRHTHWLGIGGTILKDSYLSPLSYGGISISYLGERSRLVKRKSQHLPSTIGAYPHEADPRRLWLSSVEVNLSSTNNPARNASIYRIQGRGNLAHMWQLGSGTWGELYAGPNLTLHLGGLYHSRNGNNPATLQLGGALGLATHYGYKIHLAGLPLRLRHSLQLDVLGTAFSQEYGESYYELYYLSEEIEKRFHLTHWGNSLALRSLLSLDIPISNAFTLALGWRASWHTQRLNHLESRTRDHALMLGITSYRLPLSTKKLLAQTSSPIPF